MYDQQPSDLFPRFPTIHRRWGQKHLTAADRNVVRRVSQHDMRLTSAQWAIFHAASSCLAPVAVRNDIRQKPHNDNCPALSAILMPWNTAADRNVVRRVNKHDTLQHASAYSERIVRKLRSCSEPRHRRSAICKTFVLLLPLLLHSVQSVHRPMTRTDHILQDLFQTCRSLSHMSVYILQ